MTYFCLGLTLDALPKSQDSELLQLVAMALAGYPHQRGMAGA